MKPQSIRQNILVTFMALGFLAVPILETFAAPTAQRVSPQRLTVFVGQGEYRVRIEGNDLGAVDRVLPVDASQTGYMKDVPEVTVRILDKSAGVMTVLIRADSAPESGSRLQLRMMDGQQGYLIPAGLFQFEVR
jgi:hypothetical protein